MIGYHATLKSNALSIIKEKGIKLTNEKNSIYGIGKGIYDTTKGYVYLATTIEKALDFGLRAWGRRFFEDKCVERQIYIFEVVLDDMIEIFIDEDEVRMEDVGSIGNKQEFINKTASFRVNKKLRFNEEIYRYTIIEFKDMNQGYELINSDVLDKSTEWNILTGDRKGYENI